MTRWEHFLSAIRFPRSAIVVQRPKDLTDRQITRIVQATPETMVIYRAFMQLLEQAREDAIENLAADSPNPTAMAMHAGGARYLKRVRDDIIRRRHEKD